MGGEVQSSVGVACVPEGCGQPPPLLTFPYIVYRTSGRGRTGMTRSVWGEGKSIISPRLLSGAIDSTCSALWKRRVLGGAEGKKAGICTRTARVAGDHPRARRRPLPSGARTLATGHDRRVSPRTPVVPRFLYFFCKRFQCDSNDGLRQATSPSFPEKYYT